MLFLFINNIGYIAQMFLCTVFFFYGAP